MPYGLTISLILHAVLLGWALFLVEAKPLPPVDVPEAASISLLADDGVTRQKQGDEDAKNADAAGKEGQAKELPKQEVKAPPPPPPPPPPAAAAPPPPPPPEPAKAAAAPSADDQKMLDDKLQAEEAELAAQQKKAEDVKKKAEADAKAKAEADAKAKAEAERKRKLAEEQRKKLAEAKKAADAKKAAEAKKFDNIASVLEKIPDGAGPQKAMLNKAPPKPDNAAGQASASATSGPQAGTKNGTDKVLVASRASMIRGIMLGNVKPCWNLNAGMEGANKLIVTMEFKLDRGGHLLGDPRLVNAGSGPQFEDAVNAAKRALIDCQNHNTNLPADLYDVEGGWSWMRLEFDPSKMF